MELADPDHPLWVAAVGVAARGRWVLGEFSRARSLAELARGRTPSPGVSYLGYPEDALADVVLYEGDAQSALAHYQVEAMRARSGTDPF